MKKRIGNIIFYGICLVLGLIILAQLGVLPFRFVIIQTGSMQPTIEPGDVVVVNVSQNLSPEPGDVAYFNKGDTYVVHRIIDITEAGIQTKGDANEVMDSVPVLKIDGIVLFKIPKIGYPIDFIQSLIREAVSFLEAQRE